MARERFNCGQRLREFMAEKGLTQAQVAESIGETPQSVSAKSNKNDLKVSDIEQIMWSQKMELWEFFVTEKELSEKFNVSLETIKLCKLIDGQPAELREMLAENAIRTVEYFTSARKVSQ